MTIPDWLQADLSDEWPVEVPHAAAHAVEVALDKIADRIDDLPGCWSGGAIWREDVLGLLRGDQS